MSDFTFLVAPAVYLLMILYLVWENQRGGRNDKFPCVIVKAREQIQVQPTYKKWGIRLINVGRGPAFIKRFTVNGLTNYHNGDCTERIDKVLGPDVGDPHLQIEFAYEDDLAILRDPNTTIEIQYEDMAGRLFISGIEKGIPVWKPPTDFTESLFQRTINCLKSKRG
jgi:hypothetical protein